MLSTTSQARPDSCMFILNFTLFRLACVLSRHVGYSGIMECMQVVTLQLRCDPESSNYYCSSCNNPVSLSKD